MVTVAMEDYQASITMTCRRLSRASSGPICKVIQKRELSLIMAQFEYPKDRMKGYNGQLDIQH